MYIRSWNTTQISIAFSGDLILLGQNDHVIYAILDLICNLTFLLSYFRITY